MRLIFRTLATASIAAVLAIPAHASEPSEDEMLDACVAHAKSLPDLAEKNVEANRTWSDGGGRGFSVFHVQVWDSKTQAVYRCMYDETSWEVVSFERR